MAIDSGLTGVVGGGEAVGPSEPTPAPVLAKPAKGESRWAVVLPPLLLGLVLIGIWYAMTYLVLDEQRRFLLPAPHKVISEGFFGEDRRGDSTMSIILGGLRRSAIVAAMGLGISIVIGFTTAVIMSQAAKAERAIFPYMVMLQATPILALVPLIGFWFGYSTMPRVIVCVIISLFPIIVNTLFGLQSADQGMHDLFTLQHASRMTRLRTLMFPAAMPAIFAGLRISAGLAVIGAIVGDFFFGQGTPGLGQVLKRATGNNESELLIATVIVACLLGVVVFLFFGWLSRRVTSRWHSTTGAG